MHTHMTLMAFNFPPSQNMINLLTHHATLLNITIAKSHSINAVLFFNTMKGLQSGNAI